MGSRCAETVFAEFEAPGTSIITAGPGSGVTLNRINVMSTPDKLNEPGYVMSLFAPSAESLAADPPAARTAASAWLQSCEFTPLARVTGGLIPTLTVSDGRCRVFSNHADGLPCVVDQSSGTREDPILLQNRRNVSSVVRPRGERFTGKLPDGRTFLRPDDDALVRVLTESGANDSATSREMWPVAHMTNTDELVAISVQAVMAGASAGGRDVVWVVVGVVAGSLMLALVGLCAWCKVGRGRGGPCCRWKVCRPSTVCTLIGQAALRT